MNKICRLCLAEFEENNNITIFSKFSKWNEKTAWDVLSEIVYLQRLENDPLPKSVCWNCFDKLQEYYEFHNKILLSDRKLKEEYIQLISQNIWVEIEEGEKHLKHESCDKTERNNDKASDGEIDTKLENSRKVITHRKKYRYSSDKKTKTRRTKTIRKCVECNKTFNRKSSYESHMVKHSGIYKYVCEFCPKKFVREVGLVYHRRVHTGEKPYSCSLCSKSFKTPSEIHSHKKTHTNERDFRCIECNASFKSRECLKNHIRRHTGERPFLCEICSKEFVSRANLATHIKSAHNEKETCSICQKLIAPLGLKKHLQRHANQEKGIKNFICDQCGKRFTEAAVRKKHMLIHTGEKPFACETCGKRFTQKSTLTNHTRVHSDILPFPCNFCEKGFRYKHHLRSHITVHHKDVLASEGDRYLQGDDIFKL